MSLLASWLMILSILSALWWWRRQFSTRPEMILVAVGALCGAALGAKAY